MNKTILIGGAPTAGKSTYTRKLAGVLNLPWISTDDIRAVMVSLVRKEDYPHLFDFVDDSLTAESYLSSHAPEEIVEHQNIESEEVWKGVKAFLDTGYVWKNYIVEGVAILPKFVANLDKVKYDIKPIFLVDENQDRIREIVYKRGIWDDADKYPDSVKEIEVQWATLFNQYIKSECQKYGINYYLTNDREATLKELNHEISAWLENGI